MENIREHEKKYTAEYSTGKEKKSIRRFMAIALLFLVSVLFGASCANTASTDTYLERTGFAFDTVVNFKIYGTKDEKILDEVMKICEEMEMIFSAHHENSEIYRLNHRNKGEREWVISDDLKTVITAAQEISELSDGAFDITIEPVLSLWDFQTENPTVPLSTDVERELRKVGFHRIRIFGDKIIFSDDETRIDLGAIAKGYIADKIKWYLQERGVESAIINLGGNVLCIGKKPGGEEYKVGLRAPFQGQEDILGYVILHDSSVVSSGVYERHFEKDGVNYHHILDTSTGYPIQNGLTQVSIVSESSMLADALSTSCFSLGTKRGMELLAKFPGTYAYFVHENGEIEYSEGAGEIFHIGN